MPLFGKLFDFDGDGKLSAFEKAAELGFLAQIREEEESEEDSED